jgi:hypothetical protein
VVGAVGWGCGRRFAPILARLAGDHEDIRGPLGRSARTYGSGPRLRRVPRPRLDGESAHPAVSARRPGGASPAESSNRGGRMSPNGEYTPPASIGVSPFTDPTAGAGRPAYAGYLIGAVGFEPATPCYDSKGPRFGACSVGPSRRVRHRETQATNWSCSGKTRDARLKREPLGECSDPAAYRAVSWLGSSALQREQVPQRVCRLVFGLGQLKVPGGRPGASLNNSAQR